MWQDLLAALALVLVIEGLTPFINPKGSRRMMQTVSQLPDRTLRIAGLSAMLAGAVLLCLVRHA
mgnify:CR=1 FL=1